MSEYTKNSAGPARLFTPSFSTNGGMGYDGTAIWRDVSVEFKKEHLRSLLQGERMAETTFSERNMPRFFDGLTQAEEEIKYAKMIAKEEAAEKLITWDAEMMRNMFNEEKALADTITAQNDFIFSSPDALEVYAAKERMRELSREVAEHQVKKLEAQQKLIADRLAKDVVLQTAGEEMQRTIFTHDFGAGVFFTHTSGTEVEVWTKIKGIIGPKVVVISVTSLVMLLLVGAWYLEVQRETARAGKQAKTALMQGSSPTPAVQIHALCVDLSNAALRAEGIASEILTPHGFETTLTLLRPFLKAAYDNATQSVINDINSESISSWGESGLTKAAALTEQEKKIHAANEFLSPLHLQHRLMGDYQLRIHERALEWMKASSDMPFTVDSKRFILSYIANHLRLGIPHQCGPGINEGAAGKGVQLERSLEASRHLHLNIAVHRYFSARSRVPPLRTES